MRFYFTTTATSIATGSTSGYPPYFKFHLIAIYFFNKTYLLHNYTSNIRSFTTSEAIISPATEGTKAILPGTAFLLWLVSRLAFSGSSSDHTTFKESTFRLLSSLLITLAKGQILVSYISPTLNSVVDNLLPAPIELIIGIPNFLLFAIKLIFEVTVSIASTM